MEDDTTPSDEYINDIPCLTHVFFSLPLFFMLEMSTGDKKKKTHRPLVTNPKIINPYRTAPEGATHMRDRSTIKRLQMYKTKVKYDGKNRFIGGDFLSRKTETPVVRIQPDRRWFGNTRIIGQKELEAFREQMANKIHDPYTVILRQQKLPLSLINPEPTGVSKVDLLAVESFDSTFGPKAQRKKTRVTELPSDYGAMVESATVQQDGYSGEKDLKNASIERDFMRDQVLHPKLKKGTSKRIWNELYKVIDASDVIIQVLDARDPMGTRCKRIEDELKTRERRHKHMIFVLNKVDLVPVWATRAWIQTLSQEYPTIAMHASITNPFGKSALLNLLRQLSRLHSDKKQISVGFVGYPNVGKSSLINTLMGSIVCQAAPVPGETKHWRYVTLFKRVYLIDCPGIVPPNHTDSVSNVLKGAVRIEQLEDPTEYIAPLMAKLRPEYLANQYGIPAWSSPKDFLELLCFRTGKLLKGGDPNLKIGARMVLQDWLQGRLPHFAPPPHRQQDWVQLSSLSYEGYKDGNGDGDGEGGAAAPVALPQVEEYHLSDEEDEDGELSMDDGDDEAYTKEYAAMNEFFQQKRGEGDDDDDDDDDDDEPSFDDGLNDQLGDSDDDEFYENAREKIKKIKTLERREKKMTVGIDQPLQDDEWVNLHVKSKYRNADLSEEAFFKSIREKQALVSNEHLKEASSASKNLVIDESGSVSAFGALSYAPAEPIILAGELTELDADGKKKKRRAGPTFTTDASDATGGDHGNENGDDDDSDDEGGYVVTVGGGMIISSKDTNTQQQVDPATQALFMVQPQTKVGKHDRQSKKDRELTGKSVLKMVPMSIATGDAAAIKAAARGGIQFAPARNKRGNAATSKPQDHPRFSRPEFSRNINNEKKRKQKLKRMNGPKVD